MATGVPKCAYGVVNISNLIPIVGSATYEELPMIPASDVHKIESLHQPLEEVAADSLSMVIGVCMGLGGSVFINIGQNLQSLAMQRSEAVRAKPCTSRLWIIGITTFILGSCVNFAAFSFAPASILVPLEAVQFVTNVIFNKYVCHTPISTRMGCGVLLAIMGVVLVVVFGPSDARCFELETMSHFWLETIWWVYLFSTLALAACCYMVHRRYSDALRAGLKPRHHEHVLPITFAVYSALIGGAQMIVHSKVVAELIELFVLMISAHMSKADVNGNATYISHANVTYQVSIGQKCGLLGISLDDCITEYGYDPFVGQPFLLTHWYLYVELLLLTVCGVTWVFKMNESLGLYDPLFIIPLLQSTYILFGVIAGGIYFQEFTVLSEREVFGIVGGGWIIFITGMFLIMSGLYLIAPPLQMQQKNLDTSEINDDDGITSARERERSSRQYVAAQGTLWYSS